MLLTKEEWDKVNSQVRMIPKLPPVKSSSELLERLRSLGTPATNESSETLSGYAIIGVRPPSAKK